MNVMTAGNWKHSELKPAEFKVGGNVSYWNEGYAVKNETDAFGPSYQNGLVRVRDGYGGVVKMRYGEWLYEFFFGRC